MATVESAGEAKFLFHILETSLQTSVVDFSLNERISGPFELNVSVACEDEIKFEEVIGKQALLTIFGDPADRYCHGIISKFMQVGSKGHFNLYQARIVPSLWLLSLEQDCRIFQNKKVEDIVKQVLQERGITSDRFAFKLQNQYPEREYCVQYRENDLNFISRLLEEEGIFYCFEHFKDKHLLIFGDSAVAYQPIPGGDKIKINPSEGMVPDEECVYAFTFSQRILSGKITQKDFNFEQPSLDLTAKEEAKSYKAFEIYDYPGRYLDQNRGKKLTKIRVEESMAFKDKAEGQSVSPRFAPGFTFSLIEHDRQDFNQPYLLVEVIHTGAQPQVLEEQAASGMGSSYSNFFTSIPSSVTYRPERKSPKPVVEGIETAIVVGPKGEEIYTDKYGRVKAQFHWDREGLRDEKSSCWIRVAQLLAGPRWGGMFIPRIGQEVVVDFLEGDPDRPMIIGCVYHGSNMPPYPLPGDKTKSVIKSDSTLGGGGSNEIRFEDKKGGEEIYLHAQKDEKEVIENDRTIRVGGTHTETIQGDTKIQITDGTFEHDVAANTAKYHVASDIEEDYDATQKTTVAREIVITSEAAHLYIKAATEIKLEVGASTFLMKSDGSIQLSGINLAISGKQSVKTSGMSITSVADADHNIKGAIVISEGSAANTVKGGMVMLNP